MPAPQSFIEQKAPNAIRARLLTLLGVPSLYALDRIDLTADSTLDTPTQSRVVEVLAHLGDAATLERMGMTGFRLLEAHGAPFDKVVYSVMIYERGPEANHVRVQADNLDRPMDINEGAKLDLGSTAKFRTTITYLQIISELHGRYASLKPSELNAVVEDASDALTRWAATWLASAPDRSLAAMLDAAMNRRYSASPAEHFFTGGGVHIFHNFEPKENGTFPTVTEALRDSVNLAFIRVMRDVAKYYEAEGAEDPAAVLEDQNNPARQSYLERFADQEGSHFLTGFQQRYQGRSADEALSLLASRVRPVPHRLAVVFRSVRPGDGIDAFARFLKSRLPDTALSDRDIQGLYTRYGIDRFNLADRGYIAGIHPLELWLVSWLQTHPGAKRSEILAASADQRQETYQWLFKTSRKTAQDTRIRILMEEEAFTRIHATWQKLGYPFERLTPSYAAAIGASGDRPGALAELMGIIVNDGIKLPTVRVERLHFAAGTPYETTLALAPPPPERVLSHEIVVAVRKALVQVVAAGTARRTHDAFTDADGVPLEIGGKTGTGDHRFGKRVVERTGTFVFYAGDRFFGTLTAHVEGGDAARYKFSSALCAQLLKSLAPQLQPLIGHPGTGVPPGSSIPGASAAVAAAAVPPVVQDPVPVSAPPPLPGILPPLKPSAPPRKAAATGRGA